MIGRPLAEIEADLRLIAPLEGMYAALLEPEEREALNRLTREGRAKPSYQEVNGELTLAKVRLIP